MAQPADTIVGEIQRSGPISFARFMDLALYCPESGYYERTSTATGKTGDFFTSVNTGGLFGGLLAFQFACWLERLPQSQLHLVEAGAHHAQLACDMLSWFSTTRPDLFQRLQYWIVEPSPTRQSLQKRALEKFAAQVQWFADLHSLLHTGVHGIIFSNELLDAMPVQRLHWNAREKAWRESAVHWDGRQFVWCDLPEPASPSLLASAGFELSPQLLDVLPHGFRLEISPAAARWWHDAACALRSGKLLTLDYGWTAEEWLSPERGQGTLRAYYRHAVTDLVLDRPGEQDITAHVNFTQLQSAGEAQGLRTDTFSYQEQFLVGILHQVLQNPAAATAWGPSEVRQFHTLTHADFMGRSFRVLVQSRC